MERKSYVINGIFLSNLRAFCEFIFGQFYIRADINRKENIFEITVRNKLNVKQEDGSFKEEPISDYIDTKHFESYWNGKDRVKIKILTFDSSNNN